MVKTFRVIDDNIFDLICNVIQLFYDNYVPSDSFGCCGKYLECSDNMKCMHPDNNYSKGCYYRANLENGKIFYGANKNI